MHNEAVSFNLSLNDDNPIEVPEVDPIQTKLIENRRKKKLFSRVVGPRIEGYECPRKVNRSPTIQVNPQQLPQTLMTTPRAKDVIALTEEGLDDWFAQSLNRKMESLVLSKKEYYMPTALITEMKARWSQKPRLFNIETSELQEGQDKRNYSLYFDHKKVSPRLLVEEPSRLLFDYSMLQPKNVDGGTPVKKIAPISLQQKNPITNRMTIFNTVRNRGIALDTFTKMQSFGDQDAKTPNQEHALPQVKGIENRFQKAVRKGTGLMRLMSRAKTPTSRNDGPADRAKTPQKTKEMSVSVSGSVCEEKVIIPYRKNAADLLRDEELMKENEEFLQKLIEKLNSRKENPSENTQEELAQYDGDLRYQKMTFERNIYRKIGSIAETRKEEISDFIKSPDNTKEASTAFSRLKEITQSESPKKIPDRKVRKLLSQDQIEEDMQKRYLTIRPTSPAKYSRNMMTRRSIERKKNMGALNRTIEVINTSPSKNYSPQSTRRIGLSNRQSTLKSESPGWRFSKEAKERFVNKFFEMQTSGSPDSRRRLDSCEGTRDLQTRRDQEMSRKVYNALNRADNLEESINIATDEDMARSVKWPSMNIRLEKLKMRGVSMTIDRAESSVLNSKEKTISGHESGTKSIGQEENTDFWFVRGSMQMDKGNFYNAIDCFKQILLINPRYYLCIFNIGCMYERLNNYEAAKKWLKLSYEVNFCKAECLYGLALCDFKSGNAQACFDYLTELEDSNKEKDPYKDYLKALCCKELGKVEEASEYYLKVHKEIKLKTGHEFAKKIFTSLFLKTRGNTFKIQEDEAKMFLKTTQHNLELKTSKSALDSYCTPEREWKPDYMDDLAQRVKALKFWKRFPLEYLRTFLGYMNIEKFAAETVMHPKENTVFVIVTGTIAFKDHSQGFLAPKIMSFLQEGDILGYEEIDNGIYKKAENWLICQSDVEILAIKKEDFLRIWEAQKTVMRIIYVDILLETVLFKNISLQTLYVIGYDIAMKETHKGGQVIYNDNSYMSAQEFSSKIKKKVINEKALTVNENEVAPKMDVSFADKKTKGKASGILRRNFTNESNHAPVVNHLEKNINRGMFVILSGECKVEAKDGYVCTTLSRGDFFGESLLLGTKGYNNFGLIRCKSDEVEVLYIPKSEFWRIPEYDIDLMIQNCQNRRGIRNVISILENRKK